MAQTAGRPKRALTLASRGKARSVIVTQPGATPAELHAAEELAHWLGEIDRVP